MIIYIIYIYKNIYVYIYQNSPQMHDQNDRGEVAGQSHFAFYVHLLGRIINEEACCGNY